MTDPEIDEMAKRITNKVLPPWMMILFIVAMALFSGLMAYLFKHYKP